MTAEQTMTVRLNIAMKFPPETTVERLQEIFEWVMGPKTAIVPATVIGGPGSAPGLRI